MGFFSSPVFQRTYIFTFLLSSRLFLHPYELMSKVYQMLVEHQRLSDPHADKVKLPRHVLHSANRLMLILNACCSIRIHRFYVLLIGKPHFAYL